MNPLDFVFNSIYKGAKNKGASEINAHQQAIIGSDIYRKNAFKGKAHQVITEHVNKAVKLTKMVKN